MREFVMATQKRTQIVRATAVREGAWWIITLPDLDTVTQARHVRDISPLARDLAALWLDVPVDDVELDLVVEIPGPARSAWEAAKAKEIESRAIAKQGGELAREAVRLLRASDISGADAAELLHVSKQRISQLLH